MDSKFEAYTAISCSFCGEIILGCENHNCYNINDYNSEKMSAAIGQSVALPSEIIKQSRKDNLA